MFAELFWRFYRGLRRSCLFVRRGLRRSCLFVRRTSLQREAKMHCFNACDQSLKSGRFGHCLEIREWTIIVNPICYLLRGV